MPVEALLTLAPTHSSQWMAALVAALPQIIIDLPIFTLIYVGYSMIQRVQLVVSVECVLGCLRCFNFMPFGVDNSSGSCNTKII